MSFAINTNVQSLNAQRNLMKNTNALGSTFQRLSSGLRINAAKDDSAGLSITTRMTAQVRALNQSVRNANDAISLVQVAEGALDETTNALQRMRELSVQAANDTYTAGDREDMEKEMLVLIDEINRIAVDTQFNDQNLLNGNSFQGGKKIHVGADAGQTMTISIISMGASAIKVDTTNMRSFGFSANAASNQAAANSAIIKIDSALDSVSDMRATLGSYQNRFESIIANLSNVSENTAQANSRIVDADIAAETADLTRNAILQQAGVAILAQANQQPQIALQLLG